MMLKIYSVMDVKASAFMSPFFTAHDGQAVRSFGDACNDEKSMFARHPEDFALYRLGEFDDVAGKLKAQEVPEFIIRAVDMLPPKEVKDASKK